MSNTHFPRKPEAVSDH